MDLRLSETQNEFQSEVRQWLEENAPRSRLAPPNSEEGFRQHQEWERALYEAGFAAVHWPAEYGGRGMDAISTALFYDEYLRARAPERLNRLALGLAGPTLIEFGEPAQRDKWLTNMLTCSDIWCQGFSEPDAGSDLASLRTRGEVGDETIRINGQKTWTSHSRFADWIFALVRTDPELPKHKGISFVMIDRHAPGVEVRPIAQMNHASDFGELFFTDVEVPRSNVIGGLNNGWAVAMGTLKHERGSNLNTAAHFHRLLEEVLALVPASRRHDREVRQQVARFHEDIEAYRYMTLRTLSAVTAQKPAGPQSVMGKLWWSEMQTRILEFGLAMLGNRAEVLSPDEDDIANLVQRYWLSRASYIYAGTNEVQRNIIAERVLGLPKGS